MEFGPYGSRERYTERLQRFEKDGAPYPKLRHYALWLLHNCVSHPLLAIYPGSMAVEFHDLTSQWLNGETTRDRHLMEEPHRSEAKRRGMHLPMLHGRWLTVRMPKIQDRKAWVVHNALAHIAIGIFPCTATFSFHDRTADKMKVPGWV